MRPRIALVVKCPFRERIPDFVECDYCEHTRDPPCLVRKLFANKLIGAKPRRIQLNRLRCADDL